MGKKIIRIVSIAQLFVGIFIYICLAIEFKSDAYVMRVIADFDATSKIYNLALYLMPAIHIMAGLLGLVLDDAKKLMLAVGIVCVLFALVHVFYLQGYLQIARAIASNVFALAFLIGSILIFKGK